MALRMILTAMVVSMSLPMPSVDTCRSLVKAMNQELSAALTDVGTELVSRFPDGSEFTAGTIFPESAIQVPGESKIYAIDETFANILDEFANEATRPAFAPVSIEQAAIDAQRIPLEPVNHPLPPAAEALEVLPSAADLIRTVSEECAVRSVESASPEWMDVVAGRCGVHESFVESVEMTYPVDSSDIGPWLWVEEYLGFESDPIVVTVKRIDPVQSSVTPVESITSEWLAVVGDQSVEDRSEPIESNVRIVDSRDANSAQARESTIRDAFRKTAEAIALWSKVMPRPY